MAIARVVRVELKELYLSLSTAKDEKFAFVAATALVNEAYMRLVDFTRMQWQDRAHFFAVAAQLMRRSLDAGLRKRSVYRQVGHPCPRWR